MKDETRTWLEYAHENLSAAKLLLDHDVFNPCLQNVQQTVEKMLKALLVESGDKVKRTHSISELVALLSAKGLSVPLVADECDLLDSIYLPSKYPLGSALPDFEPDRVICDRCVGIALRLRHAVEELLTDR
ncbi:MAG: DNA-binding protein [Planctomycetes bacterium RBG_13_62_9]|nr:MAG: DNA-binding protein [Planctomycetes bacterium RBG_13_62_9]